MAVVGRAPQGSCPRCGALSGVALLDGTASAVTAAIAGATSRVTRVVASERRARGEQNDLDTVRICLECPTWFAGWRTQPKQSS